MFYGSNYLVTLEPYLIVTSLQVSTVPAVTLECRRHSPSPYYLLPPHRHFPHQGQCCGWTGPYRSSCDCRMHFGKNNQGTLKSKIYYSQVLESTWHAQELHSEGEMWGMGKAEREQTWARTLLGSEHGCLRLHETTHCWPIWSTTVGTGNWRPGHWSGLLSKSPRVFSKGNFMGVGALFLIWLFC